MAKKDDLAVKILTAETLGTTKNEGMNDVDVAEAHKVMSMLASHPTPDNRYEIAQITAFTVDNVMKTAETWLSKIAEVKNVDKDEKAIFKVQPNTIKAYIQAKGSTTPRSKVFNKFITVDTLEVSARPYINYSEMTSGNYDFAKLITYASMEMEAQKLGYIDKVLRAAATSMEDFGTYASGAGIVKATFDKLLQKMQRLGNVSIIGDIYTLAKFNDVAGYKGTSAPSDEIWNEIMQNGYMGRYLGANLFKIDSPLKAGTLDPIVNEKWCYLIAGLESPLKVVNEGSVTSLDTTNIDDNSYEMVLRQNFGAGFVLGDVPTIGAYQDLTA